MKYTVFSILFIFSILIQSISCYAQDDNPFEIKSRLRSQIDSGKVETVSAGDTSILITSNPFEINLVRPETNKSGEFQISPKQQSFPVDSDSFKNSFSGESSGFLLWVIMFILVIFAIVVSLNREMAIKLVSSAWLNNLMSYLFRNFGSKDLLLYFLLYLNFAVNMAVFLYVLIRSRLEFEGLNLFLLLIASVVLIYFIKHLAIMLFQKVFTSLKEIISYSFSVMIYNIVLGIALMPVNIFASFSSSLIAEIFIYLGLLIIVLFYLFRLFRGFLSTYSYFISSIFHYFMYLCAFEILPLLLLYRFIVNF
jgi:hypothetical protein